MELVELPDGREVLAEGIEDGLPTFRWRSAPAGLATRRQLRACGLRPGRQDPAAQIKWRRGRRWAALYRVELAVPCRVPTEAQRRALALALAARRQCAGCGRDVGYVVPRRTLRCVECDAAPVPIPGPRRPDPAESITSIEAISAAHRDLKSG